MDREAERSWENQCGEWLVARNRVYDSKKSVAPLPTALLGFVGSVGWCRLQRVKDARVDLEMRPCVKSKVGRRTKVAVGVGFLGEARVGLRKGTSESSRKDTGVND